MLLLKREIVNKKPSNIFTVAVPGYDVCRLQDFFKSWRGMNKTKASNLFLLVKKDKMEDINYIGRIIKTRLTQLENLISNKLHQLYPGFKIDKRIANSMYANKHK